VIDLPWFKSRIPKEVSRLPYLGLDYLQNMRSVFRWIDRYCQTLLFRLRLGISLCYVTRNGEFKFFALISFDHQDYPEYKSYYTQYPAKYPNDRDRAEDDCQNRVGPKNDDRLHGMETHELVFSFQNQKYQTCDPSQYLTQ
jgi:hypothetical protein